MKIWWNNVYFHDLRELLVNKNGELPLQTFLKTICLFQVTIVFTFFTISLLASRTFSSFSVIVIIWICPIFVTYDKKEDISDSTKYLDEFVNRNVFSWMTRSRLKLDSKEVVAIKNYQKTNLKIHLFIKKSDDEGKDFYYMGQVEPFDFIQTTIKSKDGDLPIVNIKYNLHTPVKDELYDYFENKI